MIQEAAAASNPRLEPSYTIHYLGQVLPPLILLVEVPLLTDVLVALAQQTAMWL
jgi:hypothetical protein